MDYREEQLFHQARSQVKPSPERFRQVLQQLPENKKPRSWMWFMVPAFCAVIILMISLSTSKNESPSLGIAPWDDQQLSSEQDSIFADIKMSEQQIADVEALTSEL